MNSYHLRDMSCESVWMNQVYVGRATGRDLDKEMADSELVLTAILFVKRRSRHGEMQKFRCVVSIRGRFLHGTKFPEGVTGVQVWSNASAELTNAVSG